MPKKEMTVTKKGAAFYRTRMLKAGDPIHLPNRDVAVHTALGYVTEPRVNTVAAEPPKPTEPQPVEAKPVAAKPAEVSATAEKPKRKRAPRKTAAKK